MNLKELRRWKVKISRNVTWSQLAKLGTSPVMRLTALVPLIGIFLLFNEQTELVFQFPQFFKADIGETAGSDISASNLYFTYFGLCSLGIASLLFTVLCPKEIQDQPNQQLFVSQATSLETPVLAKANFQEVLDLHHRQVDGELSSNNPNYPDELKSDFHSLMQEFYTNVDHDVVGGDENFPEVMNGAGYFDFTEFARMLWMNPRVVWAFSLPVFELAPKLAKDVAFVRFQVLDYTRYQVRSVISVLYLLGFALLIFPTIRVFALLSYGLIFGWT